MSQRTQPERRISYTPPVPDGPDRPWTRCRRTRWWLVVPADGAVVVLTATLVAAAVHDLARLPGLAWQGGVAIAFGWLVAWACYRGDEDHLEVVEQGCGVGLVAAAVWLAQRAILYGTGAVVQEALPLLVMGAVLLLGWRWLYGFAKAQESLTPKAVQRRLDAQAARDAEVARGAGVATPSDDEA